MKLKSLLQLVENLQQAGKIGNLQHVCGIKWGASAHITFETVFSLNSLDKIILYKLSKWQQTEQISHWIVIQCLFTYMMCSKVVPMGGYQIVAVVF